MWGLPRNIGEWGRAGGWWARWISPRQSGGRQKRRAEGIQFELFFPSVEILDVAFFVHGVDVVRVMGGAAGGLGPLAVGNLLRARSAGLLLFSLVSVSLGSGSDSFVFRRRRH